MQLKSGAVANFIELAAALFEARYSVELGRETNPERDGDLRRNDVCISIILGARHLRLGFYIVGTIIYVFDIFVGIYIMSAFGIYICFGYSRLDVIK